MGVLQHSAGSCSELIPLFICGISLRVKTMLERDVTLH